MSNTKTTGDKSIAKITAMLLDKDFTVLIPFGDNQRYDLVVELDGKFIKIQGKTGRIINGCIRANAYSVYKLKGKYTKRKYTKEEIDCFIIYCPEIKKFFKIDVEDKFPWEVYLRVDSPRKHNSCKNFKWAKDFEFTKF